MPNWCVSELIVTGPKEDRDKLYALITSEEKTDSFLDKVIPAEDEIVRTIHNEETRLVYIFKTKWLPIEEEEIFVFFERYPKLNFELYYAERGMSFYGQYGNIIPCFNGEFKGWNFVPNEDEDAVEELVPEMKRYERSYLLSG